MANIWDTSKGEAVAGIVSVLFTSDRRLFFEHDDGSIELAVDWQSDEVFLQMLTWRDATSQR